MLAQLKICVAVCGGGQMMVEKMTELETHVQLWIDSNARIGLQRTMYFYVF